MTYTEFVDWLAFAAIEPLPADRADLHAARHLALLANINRDPKRRGHPYEASDFLVDWWQEAPPVNHVLEKFRSIAARINERNAQLEH